MDKTLFLYLKDLKIFYILIRKLEEKRIKWYVLDSLKSIPHRDSVIITDSKGIAEFKEHKDFYDNSHYYEFLNYENFSNYKTLLIHTLKDLWSIDEYSSLLISIDPGQFNIGMAFFLDNKLITTEIVHNTSKVIDIIDLYYFSLNPEYLVLKLGTGNARSLKNLIKLFNETKEDYILQNKINIYLVDEFGTTKKKYYYKKTFYEKNITKDEKAAITIGIRKGNKLTVDMIDKILNKKANPAELKHIQRISRKKSNGKVSLSLKMAEDVYQGDITIEEALKIQEDKKREKENEKS